MIDLKLIKKRHAFTPYRVDYCLYQSKDEKVKTPEKSGTNKSNITKHTGACFSTLNYSIKSFKNKYKKDCNRICFTIKSKISPNMAKQWVDFCIKNKLLPKYVSEMSSSKGFAFDLSIPPALLYVYLTNVRHMSEEPIFVSAVLRMCSEAKMNPYVAFCLASNVLINNSGHNFVPGCDGYHGIESLGMFSVTISSILGLKRFLRFPERYDKRKWGINARASAESNITSAGRIAWKNGDKTRLGFEELQKREIRAIFNNKSMKKTVAALNDFLKLEELDLKKL